MALQLPDSMEDLIYWTMRKIGDGKVTAWVEKSMCSACGKGLMGKPINEKTGKVKIRAKEYVCSECGHTEEKKEHEEQLMCNILYVCPFCKHEGETQILFKRKTYMGQKSLVFECEECKEKLPITKKMKEVKLKK